MLFVSESRTKLKKYFFQVSNSSRQKLKKAKFQSSHVTIRLEGKLHFYDFFLVSHSHRKHKHSRVNFLSLVIVYPNMMKGGKDGGEGLFNPSAQHARASKTKLSFGHAPLMVQIVTTKNIV